MHLNPAMASTAAIATAVLTIIFAAPAAAADTQPPRYSNHTVGGSHGWFFNETSNSSVTNYDTWAASQSFNLGDFLIFATNSNMTVVQTYNLTTYQLCDASGDDSSETSVYTPAGNTKFGVSAVLAVPLTVIGDNYYFSDAGDDGIQCRRGMKFHIKVSRGRGLPPELNQPPPPPYVDAAAPPPPDSPPVTVTPGASQGEAFYRGGAADHRGTRSGWLVAFSIFLLPV
ncbi:Lamin-like protein [Apostasia shenzhenica]|uniref:Lamin-like protein n=1 Tax=Apostasia shenzhenica TaxID=1088818 RepID=A0A2I0B2N9_9ASPA|nr:Lamin-like protein [Apostasia shenzhenica]